MGEVQDLEPASEALREALLDEQRRGSEQDDLEGTARAGVLVPEALDGLRPSDRLLHLVEHQDAARGARLQARRIPLRGDPLGVSQGRLVGAREANGDARRFRHLMHQGGLPHLPRAGHDLDEASGLAETPCDLGGVGPQEGVRQITHCAE